MKDQWSKVLAQTQRVQSFGFMLAMVIGGAVYDPGIVQKFADLFGIQTTITQETTLRWPIYLSTITALITLYVTLRFVEPGDKHKSETKPPIREALKQTWEAGKWIGRTPFALIIICAGAFGDSVIRMFITMTSEYYRLIEFTPVYFGFIGSGIAALSMLTASLSKWLVDKHNPTFNFFFICFVALLGFIGATFFVPYIGLLFVILLFVAFSILAFCISYYLNHITKSSIRATVLSFKSMALNLGYGLIGFLYALLVAYLRNNPELAVDKDLLFKAGTGYFPWYFVAGAVCVVLFALWRCPHPTKAFREMDRGEKA